jgi:hypothetical protein
MNSAIPRILDALGLKYVRSLRLNMDLNSAVAVVTEQYVTSDQLERLAGELETKEWVLVPKIEWDIAYGRLGFIDISSMSLLRRGNGFPSP